MQSKEDFYDDIEKLKNDVFTMPSRESIIEFEKQWWLVKGDQLWKINPELAKNSFFLSMVKKGNLNKAPAWALLNKSIDVIYRPLSGG